MEIGKSTAGAAAFLRRPVPPPETGGEAARAAQAAEKEAARGEPPPIVENAVLEAISELEPDSQPDSTIDNLAKELSAKPDAVRPLVDKLARDGFIERKGDALLGLSDIGRRAVRYTKMAKMP